MPFPPQKILIIQTAFIGDTILATSVAEELHTVFPNAQIVLLIKKGYEELFHQHPFLTIWTHDKSKKYSSLFSLIKKIRQEKFDAVINLHRYFSSNLLTVLSGASYKSGFQSFLSIFFSHSVRHSFQKNLHEIHRYHQLTEPLSQQSTVYLPKLYPPNHLPESFCTNKKYVCLFPGSVWATKQLPPARWLELIQYFSDDTEIYLCGSVQDKTLCAYLSVQSGRNNVRNIAGEYTLLEMAAIMQKAQRVYVNDSAPLHIASALNIPVTAFFCSTVTDFGFYPLSTDSQVLEVKDLKCRPCGIHGYRQCPQGHFRCGLDMPVSEARIDNGKE